MSQISNNKENVYRVAFTMDEIKPIIMENIGKAQDITSQWCLSRCVTYEIYHHPIVEFYKKYKSKGPSMADKLAFILILSYPKEMVEKFSDISELKLFSDENTDFTYERELITNEDEDDNHDCICSYEKLKYIYIVNNKYSGVTLQIGSECIKKYKIISNEELKKFKQAEKLRKEHQKEIDEGKPVGYYKELKRIKKAEKEKLKIEKEKEKIEKEKEKMEKKIKSGNFKICYKCNINLVDIRHNNLCICNKCKNPIDILISHAVKTHEINNCINCEKSFIDKKNIDTYLCKNCKLDKKVVECKMCFTELFLVDINSNDKYCEKCEKKIKKCIDCKNDYLQNNIHDTRCYPCQYNYENRVIFIECKSCKEEFIRKEKEHWKSYCEDCFKEVKNIIKNSVPKCKCGTDMVERTVKKDGPNKGRKALGCGNYPNGCGEFQMF